MDLTLILNYLRPKEEWKMSNNDYDTLERLSNTKKPTLKEIEDAESAALADFELKIQQVEVKREAALAKLQALGLDVNDLKALGLG